MPDMTLQEARELEVKALRGTISREEMEKVALHLVTVMEKNFLLERQVSTHRDMLGCPVCGEFH